MSLLVCLGDYSSWWWALQDGIVDREMAFDEGLLEQGGEAETVRVARVRAVREQ